MIGAVVYVGTADHVVIALLVIVVVLCAFVNADVRR